MFNLRLYIPKKKLIGILILNLVIKGNYIRIDMVGLKKGLVCVWVQIFFSTRLYFAFPNGGTHAIVAMPSIEWQQLFH